MTRYLHWLEVTAIRKRMVGLLAQVDKQLASLVAQGLGLPVASIAGPLNLSIPADGDPKQFQPKRATASLEKSAALSMVLAPKEGIRTRKVAILAADGVDGVAVMVMKKALESAGAMAKIVAPRSGDLKTAEGTDMKIDFSLSTTGSVLFDALYIPGGEESVRTLLRTPKAIMFAHETYLHCKAISATGAGVDVLQAAMAQLGRHNAMDKGGDVPSDEGIVVARQAPLKQIASRFIKAIEPHRHWAREIDLAGPQQG